MNPGGQFPPQGSVPPPYQPPADRGAAEPLDPEAARVRIGYGLLLGLAGMALFLGLWFQSRYGRVPLRYATSTLLGGVILVSSVLLSATSGDISVDHGAHLGGLALGVGIGAWLRPTLAARADARFGR